jgi:hypothetical protein
LHSTGDAGGRRPGAGAIAALVLIYAVVVGCADYKQTRSATYSISDVRVTTNREELGDCRLLGGVDSRDTARGCGLTVQPTPEECMKYQVRRAGGNALLLNGPVGEAYDCSAPDVTPHATPYATPHSTPLESPRVTASASPPPQAATPPPTSKVRFVSSREMARGCVYLGDVDVKAACPDALGNTSQDCIRDRATEGGGNVVFLDDSRAQIFSCETTP